MGTVLETSFSPRRATRHEIVLVAALLVATVGLILIPNPFADESVGLSRRVRADVISVDDSGVQQFGIIKQGDQLLELRIRSGEFRGRSVEAVNVLICKLELDKYFAPGDRALTVLDLDPASGEIIFASVMDHYRLRVELILAALFAVVLLLFAGWTGAKALLSFAFAGLLIWKALLPLFLVGVNPILAALGAVVVLTAIVQFLIGGITRTGLVSFLGAILGVLATCGLALLFGSLFRVHGAVRPFSETLLYTGFPHLNLTTILFAGVFIASSGAVMDVAMDVAAAMREVQLNHPGVDRRALVRSGFNVGRALIGTMTTTLLLAYSGGYTTLLMVFIAQGVPASNVLNMSYVSAEILHTLVGSFGLVIVAPVTAVVGGLIYLRPAPGAAMPIEPAPRAARPNERTPQTLSSAPRGE